MKIQYANKLTSSFLLAVDHAILSKGEAFTNTSGLFYPVSGTIYGLNAYSTPFRQLVNDESISGSIVVSGVFVSGAFLQPGQSGLVSLNVSEGMAYFSGRPTAVSGVFSTKEINTYLTTEPEEFLLFETKMTPKTRYPQTLTGMAPGDQVFPIVFVKPINAENTPFCLGGTDYKTSMFRVVVLAETQFQLYAICNILEDMAHKRIPMLNVTGLPFDAIGGFSGVPYNYTTAISGVPLQDSPYVQSVRTSFLTEARGLNQLNPSIYPAFVDFTMWTVVTPA